MAEASSKFDAKKSLVSSLSLNETDTKPAHVLKENDGGVVFEELRKVLASAREILSRKNYSKALSYFAYIVDQAPLLSNHVHDDFLFALQNWSKILVEHGRTDDLVKCLHEASKLFPSSAEIANNVGSELFRLNRFDEAAICFRRALKLDPQLSSAEENLDSIANLLVERWHFRMLNDKQRNAAYRDAIGRAVKSGHDRVLDIGSGTGILSMFAVQSGAKEVYACEMSKTMYDLSLDILSANQMQDSVHVINKKSQDLMIPDDLPERVSLVVTETLDCGLLGEGIIETLIHAKQELLATNQKAVNDSIMQVIPEGATVYGQIIQCEKIREYSKVKPRILDHHISNVDIVGGEISRKGIEPYTTEEMSKTDHIALSEPFHVMTYDFQTPENYANEIKYDVNIDVVRPGSLDAIMLWFELKLDAHDTLSSAPGRSICWEQAVYPCRLAEVDQTVATGDKATLNVRLTSNAICLEVGRITKSQHVQTTSVHDNVSITLPYQEISKLNDDELNKHCSAALNKAFDELQMSSGVTPQQHGCLVICNSPTFNPIFALWSGFSPVVCISSNCDFVQCLSTIISSEHKESLSFTDKPLEEISGSQDYQVLVVDPVEPGGLLRQGVVEDIVLAKGCVLANEVSIVLPRKIEVWGMLISSSSLCQKSHVTDNNATLDLVIADYVNTFQVKNQVDVDTESNEFDPLTDPNLLLTLDFMKPNNDESLLSLLNVTCDAHMTALKDGLADGLMYWFVLGYTESKLLSTGPNCGSHFNQVVIMFKEKFPVVPSQILLVKTSCKNSCITVAVQTV